MRACKRCGSEIPARAEHVIQDKTGARFCIECADYYCDVTTVFPTCSCSRGGNAITCECRGEA